MSQSNLDFSLLRDIAVVTFRKIEDGSIRQMICTNNLQFVPLGKWPKGLGG